MRKRRFFPAGGDSRDTVPFSCVEEAWVWFVRAQKARREGARFSRSAVMARPCEPDDIYCTVMTLYRRRILHDEHLEVLERFGLQERPPDPRVACEYNAQKLWTEALGSLSTALKDKGIIG